MWQVTCDMRHVTCDTWLVTGMRRWTFSQNFSSLALTIWERRFVEDIQKIFPQVQWLTDLISHKAVCRTAPATPGLLIIAVHTIKSILSETTFCLGCIIPSSLVEDLWLRPWFTMLILCSYRPNKHTFFLHPGLVYWDLTLPMFVQRRTIIDHDSP